MEQLPLRDLHLPEPVSWWPPAIGWWLLPLTLLGTAALAAWLIRRARRMTPVSLAIRELEDLRADTALGPNEKLRRLSILLRRVALTLFPRQEIAGLAGDDWLRWLDETLGQPRFSQGPGRLLAEAPYRPTVPAANLDELLTLSRDWLKVLSKTRAGRRVQPPEE
jgi:hypothetical protein